jgi:hypothetical protein
MITLLKYIILWVKCMLVAIILYGWLEGLMYFRLNMIRLMGVKCIIRKL